MARRPQNTEVIRISKVKPQERERALARMFKNATGDWPSDHAIAEAKKACLPKK